LPLTPDYERTEDAPPWRRTPAGWCTRYGDVRELLLKKDDALALLNGGDEVTLEFAAGSLRPVASGFTRSFFVYAVGWDKDADFHVGQGWRVEPLPFAGMDDQSYDRRNGHSRRWISKNSTRLRGLVPTTETRKRSHNGVGNEPENRLTETPTQILGEEDGLRVGRCDLVSPPETAPQRRGAS